MRFLLFFVLFLILNGRITWQICITGLLLSAALTYFFDRFLYGGREKRPESFRRDLLTFEYLGVLIIEIIKANIAVLKITLNPGAQYEPCLYYFRSGLKERSSRVLLANSITLTPGTITVELEDDLFCVHCLDKSSAADLENSAFIRLLRKREEVS